MLYVGRTDIAMKYYDKILDLDPCNTEVLYIKANLLLKARKYEEALKYFEKILKYDPDNTAAQEGKAKALDEIYRQNSPYY